MDRVTALKRIRAHSGELPQFQVVSLELFGSTARGAARDSSDVDVLATFKRPPTMREFMGLKLALEEWLGVRVDLVDRAALREGWREVVERDAVIVA